MRGFTRAAALLLLDLGRFDARLLGFDADGDVARDAAPRADPADAVPDAGARCRSMIVSHDTPNASDTPAIQRGEQQQRGAEEAAVATARPLPDECPTTPPAVARQRARLQCSVARPQLAISISVKPPMRTAVLTRVRPSSSGALPEHHEARDAEHDREQVGRPAEQEVQQVWRARRRTGR